jgi:hypothetical protein
MRNGKAMRTLVFANSDSGNSTFAMLLSARYKLHVLDLNNVAWSRKEFARFRPDEEIISKLDAFVGANPPSVVEGCYGRWMEHLQSHCTRMGIPEFGRRGVSGELPRASAGAEELLPATPKEQQPAWGNCQRVS